jgi:hypothetical protein
VLKTVAKMQLIFKNQKEKDIIDTMICQGIQIISDKATQLVPQICEDGFLAKTVQWMNSDCEGLYRSAVRCCSTFMVTTDSKTIDKALMEGVIDALYKNLFRK